VRNSVLDGVPGAERGRLLAAARRRSFAPGEVVYHEGDLGDALHLVVAGHVSIRTTTPRGDVLTLALLGPGDEFGELGLLRPDHRHTATIVALDAVETLSLRRAAFERLCADDPGAAVVLAHLLASAVERLDRLLAEAHFLPADRRVARRLAEAARMFGGVPPVAVPLTQDELASLAGVSRATANHVLRRLEERDVVRLQRHHIEVLDPAALASSGRW